MRNSKLYIFLLLMAALILRLINLDKPEGLWNDEYVSWLVASTPFREGFWGEILKQCHMPLYYLYLKPFCSLSDIFLRFTSVAPALISIPVMYLVGKEFSKKTGYISASVTAVLPFLIYYSQEVRFYSLLFLFSALVLLFTIKITKGQQVWIGYIITSLSVLLTHVLGGIFVFLTLAYIIYKRKKLNLNIMLYSFLAFTGILFFGLKIIKMLPYSQWWGVFSYTNILFLFSDFFSPILTNNVNAPNVFFYSSDIVYLILMTIPTIISIYIIIKGAKFAKGLFIIALSTILITSILALSGIIVFITKYNMEILPIFILLISLGIKTKMDKIFFIVLLLFYLISPFTVYHPAKIFRSEGHKLVCDILNSADTDKIIFTYYAPNRFYRYLHTKSELSYISKTERLYYVDNPSSILNSVKVGETVSLVFLDSVSFIPDFLINVAKVKKLPEMFITFSLIRNSLIKTLEFDYTDFDVQKKGSWTVIKARKLK